MSKERCWECGTELKSPAGLSAHVGSRPCELAKTAREMTGRNWKPCWVSDAGHVLNEADIEHERAPADYEQGGMRTERVVANQQQTKTRKWFKHPRLEEATWCPAWAQPIVELNIPSLKRIELLQWANGKAKRVEAIGTVLALGGIDALVAMESVPDEPTDGCESATQEAEKPAL